MQRDTSKPPVQERLNRIANELLAGSARVKEAVTELKEILAGDPRSAHAHLLLGVAYRIIGSPDFIGEAKAEFRQALALEPTLLPARLYLAQLYLDLGRAERAREELGSALEQQPGHPQLLALLGETERHLKNPSRAVALNRQALQGDPSLEQARYYLGLALFDAGERDEAIRELERVVQSGTRQVDAFASLGAAYIDGGRHDDAVAILERGIELDQRRPDLLIQLSRAYRLKGRLEEAQEQLDRLSPTAIGSLASGFQQQQVDFDWQFERGVLALAQRRIAVAVAALEKTFNMDPDHGPTNRHLAEAYLLRGSYKLASQHAVRAATLGSPLPESMRQLLQDKLQSQGTGKLK